MSDKLKKFIQQSKPQFDLEEPRPDLFEKIMNKAPQEKRTAFEPKPIANFFFKWMALAASIAILIVCTLFLILTANKTNIIGNPITEKIIKQQKNTQGTINPSSEIITIHDQSSQKEKLINSKNNFSILSQQTNFENKHETTRKPLINSIQSLAIEQQLNPQARNLTNNPIPTVPKGKQLNSTNPVETTIQALNNDIPKVALEQQLNPQAIVHTNNITPSVLLENQLKPLNSSSDFENTLEKVPTKMQPVISLVNTLTTITKHLSPLQINPDRKPASHPKQSKKDTISKENSDDITLLTSHIKKGIFGFLAKNTKKWTGNTLNFKNDENNEHPVLAVHYKDEKIEFTKEFKLGNFGN